MTLHRREARKSQSLQSDWVDGRTQCHPHTNVTGGLKCDAQIFTL